MVPPCPSTPPPSIPVAIVNGDGMGKNTHLSFFFVVMRGPFDGLLTWPFKQKVTLTLLNQTGKKHVLDSFHPNPNLSSFQCPILERWT